MFSCNFAKRRLFVFLSVTALLYLAAGTLYLMKISLLPEPGLPLLLAFLLYLVLIPGILLPAGRK